MYFIAAKFGAIFIMKPMEGTDALFMNLEGLLGYDIVDMELNALEHILSTGINLGVTNALQEVIDAGDIDKAQIILKYYEIDNMNFIG